MKCCHSYTISLVLGMCFMPLAVAQQPLRVVTENLPPYNYQDPQGRLTGPSADIVRLLLKSLGLKTRIEVLPWARAYKEALSQPNILIFSLLKTRTREKQFHWLTPISPIDVQVFTLATPNGEPFAHLNNIGNRTLGIVRDSSGTEFVKRHFNLPAKNIVLSRSYENLYKLNQLGRIDFFMAPGLLVQYLNHQLKTQLQRRPRSVYILPSGHQRQVYLAFSLPTPTKTVQRFKKVLRKMQQSGRIATILSDFRHQLNQTAKVGGP